MAPGTQHSHCSYCGTSYATQTPWPRLCAGCGETTWRNPLPVAVVLLPVETSDGGHGLVVVRRDIEPARGELCLPGGYIELGESWQEAAVRELDEEAGIGADPAELSLFDVYSVGSGTLVVFGLLPLRHEASLAPLVPNAEASERLVLTGPARIAFPSQTRAVASYFAARSSG